MRTLEIQLVYSLYVHLYLLICSCNGSLLLSWEYLCFREYVRRYVCFPLVVSKLLPVFSHQDKRTYLIGF